MITYRDLLLMVHKDGSIRSSVESPNPSLESAHLVAWVGHYKPGTKEQVPGEYYSHRYPNEIASTTNEPDEKFVLCQAMSQDSVCN